MFFSETLMSLRFCEAAVTCSSTSGSCNVAICEPGGSGARSELPATISTNFSPDRIWRMRSAAAESSRTRSR